MGICKYKGKKKKKKNQNSITVTIIGPTSNGEGDQYPKHRTLQGHLVVFIEQRKQQRKYIQTRDYNLSRRGLAKAIIRITASLRIAGNRIALGAAPM